MLRSDRHLLKRTNDKNRLYSKPKPSETSIDSRERKHHVIASLQRAEGKYDIYVCTSARYDPLVHPHSVFVTTKSFDGHGSISRRRNQSLPHLGLFSSCIPFATALRHGDPLARRLHFRFLPPSPPRQPSLMLIRAIPIQHGIVSHRTKHGILTDCWQWEKTGAVKSVLCNRE